MRDSLVFTIIGNDRPGVVEQIAREVGRYEANWQGSRMAQLGGKFAGMIHVEGERAQLNELKAALGALKGITVVVEEGIDQGTIDESLDHQIVVSMLGLDRPGIVREVASALAAENLNVLELETDVSQAAMTGGLMFNGRAIVACPINRNLSELAARLDGISRDLGVDIEIQDEES